MLQREHYKFCVVGAGIVGSSAAYHLAKQGEDVVLLEQFPLPHSRGSSHGQSRIFRHAYADPKYTELMPESLRLWKTLEKESDSQLFVNVGLLNIGDTTDTFVQCNYECLRGLGLSPDLLDNQSLLAKYPMLSYDEGVVGVYEPEAGLLQANKCIASFQKQFLANGGTIRDQQQVIDIEAAGDKIKVVTKTTSFTTEKLIITTGAYSNDVLSALGVHLPIQAEAVQVCYWPTKNAQYNASDGFPNFIHNLSDGSHIYGIPSFEYPGLLKICSHCGAETTPHARSASLLHHDDTVSKLSSYIRHHFKGVVPRPAIVEECLYAVTPDSDFIIDYHPSNSNIVIATGFSGHGFKMAPVVGKLLTQMAKHQTLNYDIVPFSLKRFSKIKSQL